ncbi:Flp family type IVb pilin [Celeribacter halophilus]|uniref:Flp family type IVb pilin n=1 Tax=Celeribacter halophilus TaxID=576117 RepID=UPI003A8F9D73
MKFFKLAKTFSRDEDGAVTVDWVVLTAAIVGLGIAVLTSVGDGVMDLSDAIEKNLTDTEVKAYTPSTGG